MLEDEDSQSESDVIIRNLYYVNFFILSETITFYFETCNTGNVDNGKYIYIGNDLIDINDLKVCPREKVSVPLQEVTAWPTPGSGLGLGSRLQRRINISNFEINACNFKTRSERPLIVEWS